MCCQNSFFEKFGLEIDELRVHLQFSHSEIEEILKGIPDRQKQITFLQTLIDGIPMAKISQENAKLVL